MVKGTQMAMENDILVQDLMDVNKIANAGSVGDLGKPLAVMVPVSGPENDLEAEKYERYISKHINNKFKIKELTDPQALNRSELINE